MSDPVHPPPARNGIWSGIPPWVVIVLAGIGAPAGVGSAVWSQNNETRLALQAREIEILQERINDLSRTVSAVSSALSARPSMTEVMAFKDQVAKLERDMDDRITRTERIELLANIEKTDLDQTRRIDRLQEQIYRHRDEMLERTTPRYVPQGQGGRFPTPDTQGRERECWPHC